MAYYLVADIKVTDPEKYKEYQALVPATIAKYDGKYLVRGGEVMAGEGNWEINRVVILEFPTQARAMEWATSDDYAPVAAIRHAASTSRSFGVEGV